MCYQQSLAMASIKAITIAIFLPCLFSEICPKNQLFHIINMASGIIMTMLFSAS